MIRTPTLLMLIFLFGIGVGGMMTVQMDYYGRLTRRTVRSIGCAFHIVFSATGPLVAMLAYDLRNSCDPA